MLAHSSKGFFSLHSTNWNWKYYPSKCQLLLYVELILRSDNIKRSTSMKMSKWTYDVASFKSFSRNPRILYEKLCNSFSLPDEVFSLGKLSNVKSFTLKF